MDTNPLRATLCCGCRHHDFSNNNDEGGPSIFGIRRRRRRPAKTKTTTQRLRHRTTSECKYGPARTRQHTTKLAPADHPSVQATLLVQNLGISPDLNQTNSYDSPRPPRALFAIQEPRAAARAPRTSRRSVIICLFASLLGA